MTSLRWLGHSTVLAELGGVRLLTDPLLRSRVAHLRRRIPLPPDVGRVDAVLVSHVHQDHLDLRSLRLADAPAVVVPAGAAGLLRGRGFEGVIELQEGESTVLSGVRVTATAARHRARRSPFSRLSPSLGFLIEGGPRVYFAGDTDLYESMASLAPVDVALLPVWGWGPKLGEGHLNPRSAAEALRLLAPRFAVPIHWGTYSLIWARGTPSPEPPREFARHAAELAPDVEVRILQPGETLTLD
jgi:L-ascorbate metabolism protein UlaG (beta-lactamase superfamily)